MLPVTAQEACCAGLERKTNLSGPSGIMEGDSESALGAVASSGAGSGTVPGSRDQPLGHEASKPFSSDSSSKFDAFVDEADRQLSLVAGSDLSSFNG